MFYTLYTILIIKNKLSKQEELIMTDTEVQVYDFEGNDVRTMMMDEEPWFLGKDIASALEYKKTQNAIERHVDAEDKKTLTWQACPETGHTKIWKGNDHSNKTIINESGMYSLIMGSKLDSAKRFKHWVTSEVLPSIRKHGIYATETTIDNLLANPDNAIKVFTELKNEREARKQAELKLKNEKEDVEFAKAVGNSKGLISMGQMSNILSKNGVDIGRTRFFEWARSIHAIKQSNQDPTQWAINMGILTSQETHKVDGYGNDRVFVTARVTPKGQKYILQKFGVVSGEINLLNEKVD